MALRITFQENDLELSAYIRKGLRKPTVPINKAPHWVHQNWDHIMVFIICGTHWDKEAHTAGELMYLVQQGIGSYPQNLRNKGKGSGRIRKTLTNRNLTTESAIKQGTS